MVNVAQCVRYSIMQRLTSITLFSLTYVAIISTVRCMSKQSATETVPAIKAVAEAMSDLNTFAIVVSILENGHLHAPSYAAANRIIKICHAEEQKRLRDYDRAMVKAHR